MTNRNERMEKLSNAGVDTGKYFTLDVNESIPAGAKIHIVIDENGNFVPEVVKENNEMKPTDGLRKFLDETYYEIFDNIIEDGYVRNTKLHRRFVMAQMFHMLNYVSYDRKYKGYNDCLKKMYGYMYTIDMMLEEVKVLSKLEVRDRETFEERSHFFTKNVIANVIDDYAKKLVDYVDKLPDHKCKGIPYKKIKGMNIFNDDLNKKVFYHVADTVRRIRYARSYAEVYRILSTFRRDMIKLPYETPKSKAWIDAFKGEGAFYTLKNLVMFHGCGIVANRFDVKFGMNAVNFLNSKLDEYNGEGWRMFALMKKVIEDNGFDFKARMEEIYNK